MGRLMSTRRGRGYFLFFFAGFFFATFFFAFLAMRGSSGFAVTACITAEDGALVAGGLV